MTEMTMTEKDRRYTAPDGSVVQRENGFSENGNNFNGSWVYRDASGNYIDHNQYRNDLAGRYKLNLKEA